jgi:hypothetical protein
LSVNTISFALPSDGSGIRDVAHLHEVVDELAHRLWRHRRALRELRETDAVEVDVHEHHRVRHADRMTRRLPSVEDAIAEHTPGLAEERRGVVLRLSQRCATT